MKRPWNYVPCVCIIYNMKTDFKNMRSRPCLSHSKANLYNKMCVYVNAMSPDDHQPATSGVLSHWNFNNYCTSPKKVEDRPIRFLHGQQKRSNTNTATHIDHTKHVDNNLKCYSYEPEPCSEALASMLQMCSCPHIFIQNWPRSIVPRQQQESCLRKKTSPNGRVHLKQN